MLVKIFCSLRASARCVIVSKCENMKRKNALNYSHHIFRAIALKWLSRRYYKTGNMLIVLDIVPHDTI